MSFNPDMRNRPLGSALAHRTDNVLLGAIDVVHDGDLCGWISDAAHEAVDAIDCTIDGEHVGTVSEFHHRHDLQELGVGAGRLGFRVPLPSSVLDGKSHTVRVHAFKSGRRLGELSHRMRIGDAACPNAPVKLPSLARAAFPGDAWHAPTFGREGVRLQTPQPGSELAPGWFFDCTPGEEKHFDARFLLRESASGARHVLAVRHAPLSGFSRITIQCDRVALLGRDTMAMSWEVTLDADSTAALEDVHCMVIGRNGSHRTTLWRRSSRLGANGTPNAAVTVSADEMRAIRTNASRFGCLEIGLELRGPYAMEVHGVRLANAPPAKMPNAEDSGFEAPAVAAQADRLFVPGRAVATACDTRRMEVVVPVFNAADDVFLNLRTLLDANDGSYRVVIVDDGSGARTARLLDKIAGGRDDALVVRHERNRGYTRAINRGLDAIDAPYIVILNSDTIVPHGWHEHLLRTFELFPEVGIVGPMSNAASWQSLPHRFDASGGWLVNPVPGGLDVEAFQRWLSQSWTPRHPAVPLLNGFCLAYRRQVFDRAGRFDEDTFPIGYGEENDMCVRATACGFELRVVDDLYVYHAKSKSFRGERAQLTRQATERLRAKHSDVDWDALMDELRHHPDLHALRQLVIAHFYGG